jgi:hypothetical protein
MCKAGLVQGWGITGNTPGEHLPPLILGGSGCDPHCHTVHHTSHIPMQAELSRVLYPSHHAWPSWFLTRLPASFLSLCRRSYRVSCTPPSCTHTCTWCQEGSHRQQGPSWTGVCVCVALIRHFLDCLEGSHSCLKGVTALLSGKSQAAGPFLDRCVCVALIRHCLDLLVQRGI